VTRTTARVLGKLRTRSRINRAVDSLLFLATVAVMLSGMLVSQVIAPALHMGLTTSGQWVAIHALSAKATFLLLLVHTALHWRWLMCTIEALDEPSSNAAAATLNNAA